MIPEVMRLQYIFYLKIKSMKYQQLNRCHSACIITTAWNKSNFKLIFSFRSSIALLTQQGKCTLS